MAKNRLRLAPRNDPLGFAQRGWTNQLIIERSLQVTGEGHVVTQLVQSLLALLVYPKERGFFKTLDSLELASIADWPIPKQVIGTTANMGQLFRHMRNAVCHGLIVFYGESVDGPDSRFVDEIEIEFSDRPSPGSPINWQVVMEGKHLRLFLNRLLEKSLDLHPGH